MITLVLHDAVGQVGFWRDAWDVTTDPAHIAAELVFTLVFDGLVIGIGWRLVKRYLDSRLRREHGVLDAEHGVDHDMPMWAVDPAGHLLLNGQPVKDSLQEIFERDSEQVGWVEVEGKWRRVPRGN